MNNSAQRGTSIKTAAQGSYDEDKSLPENYGIVALMLALKYAEIKAKTVPVHMNEGRS